MQFGASAKDADLRKQARAALDELRPSIVAVQGWIDKLALSGIEWALQNKAGVVMFSESTRQDHKRNALSEWVKAKIVGSVDAGFVGGDKHLSYLTSLGLPQARISAGYNTVDNAHFARPAQADRLQEQPRAFLCVSRLVDIKNIDILLKAYASYREATPERPWALDILGTGPLETELKDLASRLNLGASVRFHSFRKYEELPAFYHSAGALVHAARSEPWGLVLNEAAAAGLPIIATDVCGSTSALVSDGRNGFVVPPNDVRSLTDAMLKLASSDTDRKAFGRESQRLVANWGPQRFAQGLREAVEIAQLREAKPTLLNTALVKVLARWK